MQYKTESPLAAPRQGCRSAEGVWQGRRATELEGLVFNTEAVTCSTSPGVPICKRWLEGNGGRRAGIQYKSCGL